EHTGHRKVLPDGQNGLHRQRRHFVRSVRRLLRARSRAYAPSDHGSVAGREVFDGAGALTARNILQVAFFSPMPPSKSGIADYSASLVAEMEKRAQVTVFDRAADPGAFDIALYQLGNNPHHDFVYETALRYPGVVVMHEANLHHLIAHLTI